MKLHKTPYFSVVIPTYNRAAFLKDAIDSALNQSFENIEILVIDDHSEDNTHEIVSAYNDSRVQLLLNENRKGAPGARNTGINHANGKWIAFLDSDDIWLNSKLDKQYQMIQSKGEDYGLIFTGTARFDFNKNEIRKGSEYIPSFVNNFNDSVYYASPVKGFSTTVARKDLIVQAGAMDEDMPARQDPEFCIRMSKITKFAFVPEVLVYFRTSFNRNGRISDNLLKKILGYELQLSKHLIEYKKRPKAYYRMHTRIVSFALPACEWKYVLKYLPIAILSVFFAPGAFREMIAFLYNKTLFNRGVQFIKRSLFN